MATARPSVDDVFDEAIRRAPGNDRAAYLDDVCGDDADLRQRVNRLLRAFAEAGSFLESPAAQFAESNHSPMIAEGPGTEIGPYKLLEQIGEGGFGVVFLAEQERPVRRRVALKIIKPGMDTRQVIARFEAERQALAMMDHPNIAKVLDAGTTEEGVRFQVSGVSEEQHALAPTPDTRHPTPSFGRPYFVMELVQGVPITEYCDQCNLSTRERLELFITVCQAVQHAHQKGVIHRDLKPTNVLVQGAGSYFAAGERGTGTFCSATIEAMVPAAKGASPPTKKVLVPLPCDKPLVKIIDFGVAKAIDQRLTEHTLTTAFAQMVGTPLYMSPEQAELSPLGVDTRSDIYSLGVLLYELLTGTTPFDKDRLHAAPYDELRRIIREEEPPRPSARISTLAADAASTVAEHRRTDTRRLSQSIRGELDWIVMKCLEKDRNRRYETPNSLARDIERYLHDEPVQACPPSTLYRVRKFARRNKSLLAAGSAIGAALVIGFGLSTWMYVRATSESARANAVAGLLQEMLSSSDATRAKGGDYKVRELLDDFAGSLGSQLSDEPAAEADVRATIGRAYRSVRLPDQARPHFEKAIALRRELDGPHSEKLAAILVDYAWNLHDERRYSDAESQLQEALEIYRQRGVTGGELFHALEILQHVLITHRRDADAERVTQEALAVAARAGQELPDQANLLHRYADLKITQGNFAEGEKLATQAVEMHRRLHQEKHPETAFALRTLARALVPQQKLAEAEAAIREGLAVFRHQFPDDHENVRDTIYELRSVLEARGDKSALEALDREEAKQPLSSNTPDDDVRLAELLLANNPSDAQKHEAHRLFRRAFEGYSRVAAEYPNELDRRAKALLGYARAIKPYAATPGFAGVVDELNRGLERELPQLLAAFPGSNDCQWRAAMVYREWAFQLGDYTAYLPTAERAFSKSIEILEKMPSSDPNRPGVWSFLADSYMFLGDTQARLTKPDHAAAAFDRAIVIYDQHADDDPADPTLRVRFGYAFSHARLAYYLATTDRQQEATEYLRKAALGTKRLTQPVELGDVLFSVGVIKLWLGDEAGYRENCKALADVPVAGLQDDFRLRRSWIWCLGPHPGDDLSVPLKWAKEYAEKNSLGARYVDLLLLGGLHFRAGQYEQAARHLSESISAYPSDAPFGLGDVVFPQLFLAMTQWQQGKQDDARRLHAEIQPAIDKWTQLPSCTWFYRTQLDALRREAEKMIGPASEEAVENASRTGSRSSVEN
jgi:serine/threonine protein kinase